MDLALSIPVEKEGAIPPLLEDVEISGSQQRCQKEIWRRAGVEREVIF